MSKHSKKLPAPCCPSFESSCYTFKPEDPRDGRYAKARKGLPQTVQDSICDLSGPRRLTRMRGVILHGEGHFRPCTFQLPGLEKREG